MEEIPLLQAAIKPDEEQIPFQRTITYVAVVEGEVVGFVSGRLTWTIEPLKVMRDDLPRSTKRRVTYGLAQAIEGWIADRERNRSGIYEYFARSRSKVFQKLMKHWGCLEFPRTNWFKRSV